MLNHHAKEKAKIIVGSEYMGPISDPDKQQFARTPLYVHTNNVQQQEQYEEPSYREHVTQPLGASAFQPVPMPYLPPPPYQQVSPQLDQQRQQGQGSYPPYAQQAQMQSQYAPGYPAHAYPGQPQQHYSNNGYQQPYYQQPQYNYAPYGNGYAIPQQEYPGSAYGYPPHYSYAYPMHPARPSRDRYLFVISILAVICSSLATLGGLGSAAILLLLSIVPSSRFNGQQDQLFSGVVLIVALAIAGGLGGSFGLFHSIRSLLRKPSSEFKLPTWWIFLASYIGVIVIAAILRANGLAVANLPLSVFLIALAGLLPALTILSLGVRRLHFPRTARWPTRWRRFALALASGATLAIVLALVFESILTVVAAGLLKTNSGFSLDNPNQPLPSDPRAIGFLFVLVSVIAPLVEEAVKPLAVIAMIGRIESAAEAFILGLSCGIGFDLIETSGYISSGYQDWLNVALQRSTAGLLHGLGAAMVALGWYYLTHPKASQHRFLLGFGCMAYAVLQHAIWNGSFGLQLLPAPIGPYLANGVIGSGVFAVQSFLLVYVAESILMLIFFVFVTGKIRKNNTLTPPTSAQSERQAAPAASGGFQQASVRV
ncbi:MAG: hypothetical protein NVS4B12_12700 [Ktedonobacteraceae bacterium]